MRITPIVTSRFTSDGGTLFGPVPRALWSKHLEPNEHNAVRQHANTLLVELADGRKGLVDTGCGYPETYPDKERGYHGLFPEPHVVGTLETLGVPPADIAFVVLSHLHWDHVGGIAAPDGSGGLRLAFPQAQHFVHTDEWADAHSNRPELRKAYDRERLACLREKSADHLLLVTDLAPDILPGIRMARTGGHTVGHCAVVLSDAALTIDHPLGARFKDADTLVYAGDVCPTEHHLPLAYQTAYDTQPMDTRAWKLETLPLIEKERVLLMFCHDPDTLGATLRRDERGGLVADQRLAVGE